MWSNVTVLTLPTKHFVTPFQENESLVSQNLNLKSEINKLEREKKRLMDVLANHETSCPKRHKTTQGDVDGYDDIIAEFSQPPLQQKIETDVYPENISFDPLPTIKVEDMSSPVEEDIFLRPPDPINYYGDGFQSQTRLYNNHHVPGSHHFLGVMTLGHTYLDLDNRCIAL
jgi:hypothetical protein